MNTQAGHSQKARIDIPAPCGFSHISIPTRDMVQSKRFFVEVLGGDLIADGARFSRVQFGNFGILLGWQASGATAPDAEYPHYAFTVEAQDFMGIKQRLEAYGVPTHDPWGRQNRPHALMYFRDPSGNQFELFCPSGFTAVPLRLGHRAGGDYVIDFSSLCYSQLREPTAKQVDIPNVRPGGFNHMTLPTRDMDESKRFFVEILGATVELERADHVTLRVGGADIGFARNGTSGWTAADAEYPHYTFLVRPEDLLPLKERLESYGVPTHDVWTQNGMDAAMYFRDPTGNLWELYCESGFSGAVRRALSAGGDFTPDVKALNYEVWKDPSK
jgi:catechol 2,3-dioxygenase-like lactoylglutathione lyase family enzyme